MPGSVVVVLKIGCEIVLLIDIFTSLLSLGACDKLPINKVF